MASTSAQRRSLIGLGVRLALTAGVFAFLFTRIDVGDVGASIARIPPLALLGCIGSLSLAIAAGIVRWRTLFAAYGARVQPRYADLTRLYLVALFYNLLPGAVGGDVIRGYATRHYFDQGGATRSVGVVLVDRVLGLAGLFVVASIATLASPLLPAGEVLMYSALGLTIAIGGIASMPIARRLAGLLPERLAAIARSLPEITSPSKFAVAVLLSLVSHGAVSLAGHAVLSSLAPQVRLLDSMMIFPLGALAAYFPLTFAGAGARDAALVFLCAKIGVARSDALASSLSFLVCQLILSGLGGLVNARSPVAVDEEARADQKSATNPRNLTSSSISPP
jgi:glycosyltransferase 2 family protein